ncbi:MAG TPA: ABC transporter permease [Anaerolineaceae bacterium]|uniref:Inner-membrane translocator n=1 Tax=Anaerolinea thermophila TaxID=167964 RepID=A0A101FXQ5_9CHLR|nr:MAG: Inner-membrane translocator [Anaerolinea thermophila]HAF62527.1 ABC transporter permease [Anaerolineaceae bacterium]
MENSIWVGLAGVIAAGAPIVIAAVGETLTEKSGMLNLSVNGIILISAMVGFAAAYKSESLLVGYLAGMAIGALIGALLAFCTIALEQSQVAVGLVLAFLCKDLSYFLGNDFMGVNAPVIHSAPIPYLSEIPIIGRVFFNHTVVTYMSFIILIAAVIWLNRTRFGLILRSVGERPEAAYGRGIPVNKVRTIYIIMGSALVGLAGPIYSLGLKPGWKGSLTGLDGIGWIVLAITIFGGWNPVKVALGAYLFELLRWLGLIFQTSLPGIPSQVLQVAPFPLMILTLLLVNIRNAEWFDTMRRTLPPPFSHLFNNKRRNRSAAPSSLGIPFKSG